MKKWKDKFEFVSKKDQQIAIQSGTDGFTEFIPLKEGCRLVISAPTAMTFVDRLEKNMFRLSYFGSIMVAVLGSAWMLFRLFHGI